MTPTPLSRRATLCLLAGVLLLAAPGFARAERSPVEAYVRRQLVRRHLPSAAVAVVRDGKPVLLRGFGYANLEQSTRATKNTVYVLASVTKQFAATGIMLLVEDGKLSLDDSITKYLEGVPDTWKSITVRHLLNHTSGIKSYTSLRVFGEQSREDIKPAALVKLIAAQPLDFAPGQKWAYNNSAYYLVGLIIEKVSGKSLNEFLTERIFKPLGMTSTRMADNSAIVKRRAAPYSYLGDKTYNSEYLSDTLLFTAGGLMSTAADMARWDAALYGERLLKRSSLKQMWTPTRLNNGSKQNYGFGWAVGEKRGHRFVSHGGGVRGVSTYIIRYLDDRLTVIVLCNMDGAHAPALAAGIARLYLPDLVEKPIKDKDPQTTAKLRAVAAGFADGTVKPELFTEAARKLIFPLRAMQAQQYLSALGKLKSFVLLKRGERNGLQTYRYRVVFGETPLIAGFALTKDGRIAVAVFAPE